MARDTMASLRLQVQELQRENEYYRDMRENLSKQIADAMKQREDLEKAVFKKVRELTNEHGWCSVAEEAMADLGIQAPLGEVSVTVTYKYQGAEMPSSFEDAMDHFEWDEEPTLFSCTPDFINVTQVTVQADNDGELTTFEQP